MSSLGHHWRDVQTSAVGDLSPETLSTVNRYSIENEDICCRASELLKVECNRHIKSISLVHLCTDRVKVVQEEAGIDV